MTDAPSQDSLDRVDWLTFGLTSLVAMVGSWFTLSPNVTLEFSGLMSTGAMYAGVPHPPGYPVWTLYSWCFTKLLPFSNIAWRVAVGSAVASALSCGLVTMMVSFGGRRLLCNQGKPGAASDPGNGQLRIVCGTVSGLVLAFSGAVWRKAVITDIWALSLLLFTAAIFLLTRWMFAGHRRCHLFSAFLLIGMLLTNSQEMLAGVPGLVCFIMLGHPGVGRDIGLLVLPFTLLATAKNQFGIWLDVDLMYYLNLPLVSGFAVAWIAAGAIAVRSRSVGQEWRSALAAVAGLALGLALYFYVPIASMTVPPVNWGYARTLEGFEHVLARGQYERVRPTSDCVEFAKQLVMFLRVSGREMSWPALAALLLPILFLRKLESLLRNWLLGLVAVFLGVGPLMLALLNPVPDFDGYRIMMLPYFSSAYAILATGSGIGLLLACEKLVSRSAEKERTASIG